MRGLSSTRGTRAGPGARSVTEGLDQAVSGPAQGLDAPGPELLAQVADVDIDDVGPGVEVVAPDVAEQLLARQHLTRVAQERLGQRELAGRQLDGAGADRGPAAAQNEGQVGVAPHCVL